VAKNTGNKRVAVKWVRDCAKSAYEKKDSCHICGSTEDLELHHTNSVTLLLEKWAKDNGIDISTDDAIVAVRDDFIAQHYNEIYVEVFTLCNKHHVALHRVFGKAPPLPTSQKQVRWIEKQVAKRLGIEPMVEEAPLSKPKSGTFSKFY
jgi:hypothetical protein